ncbi:MAG: MbnP family protein [Flavobacteriales bacterium]
MFKSTFPFVLAIAALSFIGCKNDKDDTNSDVIDTPVAQNPTVSVRISSLWGINDFVLENIYFDNYGNRVRVDNFQSYFAMVKLIKDDGTEVLLKDFYLHDFSKDAEITGTVPPGNYVGVKFGVGVPDGYNLNQDPAQYASSHPLSVAGSQGMFWTWNSGYVFSKFEGKIDPTGTEGVTPTQSFSIHTGDSECYFEFATSSNNYEFAANNAYDVNINLHVDEILGSGPEGIDLNVESNSSGASPIGLKFTSRFLTSFSAE